MSFETIAKVVEEFDKLLAENQHLREKVKKLESKPLDNKRKLSEREVKDIRAAYRGGMMQRDLADNYSVNPATISRIVRGIYH